MKELPGHQHRSCETTSKSLCKFEGEEEEWEGVK